ncbi:hypothetical protein AB0D12_31820 [Streptomyces sp. NPDC048479]|uniref:hypothetical protein n=1 Tax=Streptomyces sp. NPDC048479 TaxID=3154725 RepID=UPI003446E83D
MTQQYPEPPAQPPASPPQPSRARTITIALASFAAGAAIVGAAWYATSGSGEDSGSDFTLTGTFSLTDEVRTDDAGGCYGGDGYDDIATGTSVTVYDAAGAVIATGGLGKSKPGPGAYPSLCVFDVAVKGVPNGQDFYKVEVSHRGNLQMTAEEAKSGSFAGSLG